MLARCAEVTEAVQQEIFHALHRHHVVLEHIVLKPNMVVSGKDHPDRASAEEIAAATLRVFRRSVPMAVPSINFLSGGMNPEESTANLNAMNAGFPDAPWLLIFLRSCPATTGITGLARARGERCRGATGTAETGEIERRGPAR